MPAFPPLRQNQAADQADDSPSGKGADQDHGEAAGLRVQVTASDINTDVLSHCKDGVFSSSSVKQEIGIEQFLPLIEPYKQAGIDDYINVRANCYKVIQNLQQKKGMA